MTTIATDGRSVAADGRGGRNDLLVADKLVKIARLENGSILGVAGRASTLDRLAAWLEGKAAFPKDCGEWAALHVLPGEVRLYSEDGGQSFNPLDLPAAVGSGSELALGAMLHGASPEQAVRVAARRDPFTGGDVFVMEMEA